MDNSHKDMNIASLTIDLTHSSKQANLANNGFRKSVEIKRNNTLESLIENEYIEQEKDSDT